jgi:hypothetical protein
MLTSILFVALLLLLLLFAIGSLVNGARIQSGVIGLCAVGLAAMSMLLGHAWALVAFFGLFAAGCVIVGPVAAWFGRRFSRPDAPCG